MHKEFAGKVTFLTVYGKEPHPSPACPQPTTFAKKLKDARSFKSAYHIPWTVAVDDMTDRFHTSVSMYPAPAVITNAKGQILTHITWAADRKLLERALRRITSTGGAPLPGRGRI